MSPCEYDELLEDYQHFHSDFQIDNFIIGSQPTPWSQYKQALRKLSKHVNVLKEMDAARDRPPQGTTPDAIEARTEFDRVYQDAMREMQRFAGHVRRLKAFFGPLTPEKRTQNDRADWQHKAVLLALEDYVDRGQLTWRTISFVLAFPRDLRRESWALISDRAGLYRLCETTYGVTLSAPVDPPSLSLFSIRESLRMDSRIKMLDSDKKKDNGRQIALERDGGECTRPEPAFGHCEA